MARSILSPGMFSPLAAEMAVRRRALVLGSVPPRAAIAISRISRVKMRPRLASVAAFLCLMVAHFECPDMRSPRSERVFVLLEQYWVRQEFAQEIPEVVDPDFSAVF